MELTVIEAQERQLGIQERNLGVQERELTMLDKKLAVQAKKIEHAKMLATELVRSGLVPKDFQDNPAKCFIAIQWGEELGIGPMQAPQCIAVINNRPAIWGDVLPGLVYASGLCEYIDVTVENNVATCRTKRKGSPLETTATFSEADAKQAKLWGKAGPWTDYPKRMLENRARAFALRNAFPDVLKGLHTAEELQDHQVIDMGNAQVVERKPTAIEAPKLKPEYPQADFIKNSPKWRETIQSGKKTSAQMISFLESKAILSAEQIAEINSWSTLAAPVESDEAPE